MREEHAEQQEYRQNLAQGIANAGQLSSRFWQRKRVWSYADGKLRESGARVPAITNPVVTATKQLHTDNNQLLKWYS